MPSAPEERRPTSPATVWPAASAPSPQDQSAHGTATQFDADADALAAGAEGGLSGWLSWTRPRRHQRPFGLGFGRDAWLIVCEVHAGGTWALRFRADSPAPWVPLSVTLGRNIAAGEGAGPRRWRFNRRHTP